MDDEYQLNLRAFIERWGPGAAVPLRVLRGLGVPWVRGRTWPSAVSHAQLEKCLRSRDA